MTSFKTTGRVALFLFLLSGTSQAVEIADSGYGFGVPIAFHYSGTRKYFGSVGVILGRSSTRDEDLVGTGEMVHGLLVDGTIGKNDYSYSIGYAGGTPVGILGAAIRATALVGRPSDEGYFLERDQKAYGIELSAAIGAGIRVGVFKTQRTHTTKFIASMGIGF